MRDFHGSRGDIEQLAAGEDGDDDADGDVAERMPIASKVEITGL